MSNPQEMEMPVPCANCSDWCELNDTQNCKRGCQTLICHKCYNWNNGVCNRCLEATEEELSDD